MIQENDFPLAYKEAMQVLLGEDYSTYIDTLRDPFFQGIRTNTKKISREELRKLLKMDLEEVAWTKGGLYFTDNKSFISKNPYYFAGLYYIQEPSAMIPAELADVSPTDKVLDLCAAPGGKSTQISCGLSEEGLLVSNDLSASRAKALLKNIEVSGTGNVLITNEEPAKLAQVYTNYFDKILVDAPCSGEGMFRKDEAVFRAYLKRGPEFFHPIQVSILQEAAKMLKPGGILVYSTCTYASKEDEDTLQVFLNSHPEFSIEPVPIEHGFVESKILPGTIRLFPHKLKGEGHFVAKLKKHVLSGVVAIEENRRERKGNMPSSKVKIPEELHAFLSSIKRVWDYERIYINKDYAYYLPKDALIDKHIRYVRTGLLLGELKKNRFEPFQALAMHLKFEEWDRPLNFCGDDPRVIRFLKGETLDVDDTYEGLRLVCVEKFPLGFVKQSGYRCKNKYYQGWRWV